MHTHFDTMPVHDEEVDECLINNLAELLGKVDDAERESSRSCSSVSDADKEKIEFKVCTVHNRKRAVDYLEEVDGEWKCVEGQVCKIPRANVKEEPKKKVKHWYCETCKMVLNSERQSVIHFEGGRHLGKVKDKQAQLLKKGIDYKAPEPRLCSETELKELLAGTHRSQNGGKQQAVKAATPTSPTSPTRKLPTIKKTQQQTNPFMLGGQPFPMTLPQLQQQQNPIHPQYALLMLIPQIGQTNGFGQ
eukprot:TRINITY_DN477_c1_g1_i5.p1 TRINITY_DN477_c1_g1~~TRINITY_DN477_c1_g1_i5.p1  ORF type:complete len:247 (+),score=60.53 TRINITY_DN477_c1_g1_i5:3-743(+)